MKILPFIEDIYDLETQQLESLLSELTTSITDPSKVELPEGINSFEKLERKVIKLKESIELELEERAQVDNLIGFFAESSN